MKRRQIDPGFADDRIKPENRLAERPSELLTISKPSTEEDKDIE